jgi:hypothetical protein
MQNAHDDERDVRATQAWGGAIVEYVMNFGGET